MIIYRLWSRHVGERGEIGGFSDLYGRHLSFHLYFTLTIYSAGRHFSFVVLLIHSTVQDHQKLIGKTIDGICKLLYVSINEYIFHSNHLVLKCFARIFTMDPIDLYPTKGGVTVQCTA